MQTDSPDYQYKMHTPLPDYIVIEGPIGVGKSSLARRLANDFDSELVLEEVDENPFLEQFYQRPREAALSTQLFFLIFFHLFSDHLFQFFF